MQAPVNVYLSDDRVQVAGWKEAAECWRELNDEARGNKAFYALTVKAAYVIGVIHDLCQSVHCLLQAPNLLQSPLTRQITYVPAYGICAAGIELLGRCISGIETGRPRKDIVTGFDWLVPAAKDGIVIETTSGKYTVETLLAMRHFAAHGQANSKHSFRHTDYEILEKLHPLARDGVERYWNDLQHSADLCNKLVSANVVALRNWPVLKSWILFSRDENGKYRSITEIFNRFSWKVQ